MQANSLQLWLTPFAIQLPTSVAALPLQHLRINSSEVQKGDVFLALPGTKTHGNQFIEKALDLGAAGVLVHTDDADQHGKVLLGDNAEHGVQIYFFVGNHDLWMYDYF